MRACLFWRVVSSYQIDWVREAVLEAVLLQELSQVRDVARGESERVQFGQLGVRRHPGQAGLQSGEGFAQHPHPRPLPRVGRVSLRLARFLLVRLGELALVLEIPPLHAFILQLLIRIPVVAGGLPRSRPVTGLVVLGITCGRASGHGCSTCASEASGTWGAAVAGNLDPQLDDTEEAGSHQGAATFKLPFGKLFFFFFFFFSPWNVTTWQCLRAKLIAALPKTKTCLLA